MKEFIDKTSSQNGTPINRAAMMAIQGFQAKTTVIETSIDGRTIITETNAEGHTLTTTITENSITEVFVGEKTITKNTIFAENKYTEEIS